MSALLLALAIGASPSLTWEPWSPEIFARARAENKLVLLDLGARWCHWCHVMHDVTYQDPEVVALLAEKFITVRVDQAHDPELANRYENYGWPATIIFRADTAELAKRRGYLNPSKMRSLLKALIADPTPGPSVQLEPKEEPAKVGALSAEVRAAEQKKIDELYDAKDGGWGFIHKYVNADAMELLLSQAVRGDSSARARAMQTLDAGLALIDPADGGLWQYSDLRNKEAPWSSPHYEKIMEFQANGIRYYASAAEILGEPKYLEAAKRIAGYLLSTLRSPSGQFYASQDADHPKHVDTHIFARENGQAIAALARLFELTGESKYLDAAVIAAEQPIAAREHLIDTLSMAQAFLLLARATGEPRWLERAVASAEHMEKKYAAEDAGFVTAIADPRAAGIFREPVRQLDENISAARFYNLLAQETKNPKYERLAEQAMRWLAAPQVLAKRKMMPGVLLADAERARPALYVTVQGKVDSLEFRALAAAAKKYPENYFRLEYKSGEKALAFVCDAEACSAPARAPEELARAFLQMRALRP